tara:strand:+ start:1673 stop:3205 length:1533 start_codon:yes stop_codon:yes gene_type:complete
MKSIIIKYNGEHWEGNNHNYDSFIDALYGVSTDYEYVGWVFFPEEEKFIVEKINKEQENGVPQMVTFGSSLFSDDADYLEFSNVYFNQYSHTENESFDTWRIKQNCGYIKSSILKTFNKQYFPKAYSVSLAVLAYASYASGAVVSVSTIENFNFQKLPLFTTKEYLLFINYIKKKKWLLYFTLCKFLYERKIVFSIKNFFNSNYKNYFIEAGLWNTIAVENNKTFEQKKVDVLIPTLGRPNYLYDVVSDLNKQEFKIEKLIIVEQKLPNQTKTLLEKILKTNWNFPIQHFLLDQIGLCNARNFGMEKSTSDYVLMFDDDVRIEYQKNFIYNLLKKIELSNAYAISFGTNGKKGEVAIKMTNELAGGASLLKRKNYLPFNKQIEGMGSDDQEYNFSVRSKFRRVVCTDEVYVNHLKAKVGGWRFDASNYLPWYKDNNIIPLPGPATLYRYLKFATPNQIKGYKLFVFFKYYKSKPWRYFEFNKRWNKSIYWAKQIQQDNVYFNSMDGIIKE